MKLPCYPAVEAGDIVIAAEWVEILEEIVAEFAICLHAVAYVGYGVGAPHHLARECIGAAQARTGAEAVGEVDAGAMKREKLAQAVLMVLLAVGLAVVAVGAPQGYGARHGLDVEAASAAGAVVDEHVGEALAQAVPIGIEPFDISYFGDTAASFGVVVRPVALGVDVEILTVVVDAVFFEEIAHVAAQIIPCFRVAEVEERLSGAGKVEEILRYVFMEVGTMEHSLGLEPHHEFRSGIVHYVGHAFQPVGES